ncbi:MAG: 4Fe-4S binding protein [Chloroflexi bacterium]|nr:4Fe-4S binding protein [Chloroflexota bacterium]
MPSGKPNAGWLWGGWPRLRKTVQWVAFFLFVVLFVWSRRGGWDPDLVNIPMRLDPLAMLANALASRTFLASSALALTTLALALLFGRAWCGWLCPLGKTLDLFSLRRWRGKRPTPPDAWRAGKYAILLTILAAALFANLTLMFLDPLTLVFRTLTVSVWPSVDQLVTSMEAALYQASFLRPALSAFESLVRPKILPPDAAFYRFAWLYAAIFAGIVLLNLVAQRFWCRYLCPLGALLGLLSKVAIVRRQVTGKCDQCNACAQVCPTGTIQPAKGYASDPSECTMCLECMKVCQQSAVAFMPQRSLAQWNRYDPGRRQAVAGFGVAVAGITLFRSDFNARRESPWLIRPPGARENDLLSKCIRCGECFRACPTSAIQPAIWEAGMEGLWTPTLAMRLGYCDYSCNACGLVCPVQAIPRLSLEEKREKVIGFAYIDENRCIPWTDYRDCIVCEEMCPVPEKAVVLERVEVRNPDGKLVSLQLPRVVRERCIGCGICEYQCPVNGEAAIGVYVPGAVV